MGFTVYFEMFPRFQFVLDLAHMKKKNHESATHFQQIHIRDCDPRKVKLFVYINMWGFRAI